MRRLLAPCAPIVLACIPSTGPFLRLYGRARRLFCTSTSCTACFAAQAPFLCADISFASQKSGRPAHFSTHGDGSPSLHHYRHPSLCRFSLWRPKPSPRSSLVFPPSLSLSLSRSFARALSFSLTIRYSLYLPLPLPLFLSSLDSHVYALSFFCN